MARAKKWPKLITGVQYVKLGRPVTSVYRWADYYIY